MPPPHRNHPAVDNLILAAMQWFFWSGFGLLFPFLVAFMEQAGFAALEIALVMSLVAAANMVGQPIWGVIADRSHRPDRLLVVLTLGTAALFPLFLVIPLPPQPHALVSMAVLATTASFFGQVIPPLIDGWVMHFRTVAPHVDYGRSRSAGSFGFAITVMVSGGLFDRFGIWLMYPLYAGLYTVAGILIAVAAARRRHIVAAVAPPAVAPPAGKTTAAAPTATQLPTAAQSPSTPDRTVGRPSLAAQLRGIAEPRIVAFFAISMVAFTGFRAAQVYLPLFISRLGGNNTQLGLSLSVMALSEVPLMLAFSWLLRKRSDMDILLFALAMLVVRVGTHIFAPTPTVVIMIQALQGLSFGLYLPASVHLMNRLAPAGSKNLAQTLAAVSSFGLGSVLAGPLGGYAIVWWGIRGMFAAATTVTAVAFVAFVAVFYRTGRRHET